MYVCFCGPPELMAQPQLSPDMAQPAMDQFLLMPAAAFGVQTNPFSVKDIFESRKRMHSGVGLAPAAPSSWKINKHTYDL